MSASETQITKFNIAPGINKNTTELDAEGIYVSCSLVRFFYGKPEQIGGWEKENFSGTIKGVTRHLHTWTDLDEQSYLGVATHKELGLLTGGIFYDITPIAASVCGSNVLNTTSGDDEIIVSLNPTGAAAGDFFVFAEVTASQEGVDFTSIYEITSVGAAHFTFNASSSAAGTCANAGGTTRVDFLLPTGNQSNGAAFGWGAGTWDTAGASASAGWSDPRGGVGASVAMRQWSTDNWGEDYIANPRGGKIYFWEASVGPETRAGLISSAAPSVVNITVVAQNGRHVIAAGTHDVSGDFDPMLIRWSDSEDFTTWIAGATNEAGEFRLENGSFIIGLQETRGQVLIFTDESLYEMNRVGGNSVFSFRDLGRHNGLMGQNASVDVNGVVYWMAYNSFQYWDGNLHTLPCTVQEFIFDPNSEGSINTDQKEKVYCETNREFNEVWWFYPSKGSTENDRYVVFNYLEQTWYIGKLERTAFHDVDIFSRPFATDSSGNLFIHEQGSDDDTAAMNWILKSSFFDIQDGDELMFVDRYVPDNSFNKEYNIEFSYKKYPQDSESFSKGPFKIFPTTRKIHPRIRGRQMQICYTGGVQGGVWRGGSDRLAVKPDGGR